MSNLVFTDIADQATWDHLLQQLNPNTFLHTWEWGQLQAADGETVRYLHIQDHQQQNIGLALVLTVKARRGTFIFCPHGPLFKSESAALTHLPSVIEKLKEIAAADHTVALRIAPLLETTPAVTSAFQKLGFRPAPLHVHTELTWMLDITPAEDTLLAGMRKTTRHAIRKAEKAGVTTEVTTDPNALERFLPLYQTTTQRHGFIPFGELFLRKQVEIFLRQNRLFFVIASHHGEAVAGGIFVHSGDTVFYHHGASRKTSSSISPAQSVQWAAIREAKRRGAARFNFWGIAPDNKPNHPFAGITVFKKGFGGYAIDYLHAQDLVLSPAYWLLWTIEMWRKFRRGF